MAWSKVIALRGVTNAGVSVYSLVAVTSDILELRNYELKLSWEKSPIKKLTSHFQSGRRNQLCILSPFSGNGIYDIPGF